MENEKLLEKLNSLFKEELWGRIEPKDIGISKFKILDDLFNSLVSEELFQDTLNLCKNHLEEHPDSITAAYLIGLIGYHLDKMEDKFQLRKLIDVFLDNHKWAVVERISEKMLEYGENRIALKALANSLERLKRNKEAIPVWENLLKIDRFDAEVAKKLAFAIIDDDPDKSIQYMKLSIEGYIKNAEYNEITDLWNKLVTVSWEDIQFFERIERMLVEAKQRELTANLLKTLLFKYRDEENPDQSIEILKKILDYTPEDNSARRELIKLYEKRYGNHSQYGQFLKLSKLNNLKYPVKHAIQNFEKNIIFDKGNYAVHRSWGVGKIEDIDSENLIIDFKGKEGHRMSIQMALQSLVPIKQDHIYVMGYEDPESLKALFKEDFIHFFEMLIKSYDGEILVGDVKRELIPAYVDQKNWSKWWSRARTEIKKDPRFGISEKKKDMIFIRDKPVTFADELLDKFINGPSFSEKMDAAIEFINNVEAEEGTAVAPFLIDYYSKQVREGSPTKQILSYFILQGLVEYSDPKKLKLDTVRGKIAEYVKESKELPLISIKISSYDYKKELIALIEETREDWTKVFAEILFETPVRIHKFIFNSLIRAHAYNIINNFLDRAITGAKQNPEIFLWVAKNLLNQSWDYPWLDYSYEGLLLTYFRLMNELKKIETKGNRLKNQAEDILYDNENFVLKEIVHRTTPAFLGKLFDLYKEIPYIEEAQKDKFYGIIRSIHPDFKIRTTQTAAESEEWVLDVEKIYVSKEGYDKMVAEHNRMVNKEMVNLSQELAKVADLSGDIRENVEYNALMEKQTILKMAINKLEDEIKKAEVVNLQNVSTETVNIGTRVLVEDTKSSDRNHYTILGPWDADFEKRILSYRSPIGLALLGKKTGDVVDLRQTDEVKKLKILTIEKYTA